MLRKVFPVVIGLMLLCGCSGHHSPIIPDTPQQDGSSVSGDTGSISRASNRIIWGLWDVTISADRTTVDVVPARVGSMHLNVVRLLEVTPCHNCLKLEEIRLVGTDTLEADVTLTHPFPGLDKYTGFDVRGVFIAQANYTFPSSDRMVAWGEGVPVVLNPDGYTSLFNPTEFPPTEPPALGYIAGKFATGGDLSATLNPYLGYRRDAPRCMFESGGTETRTYRVYAPPGPIHFGYAVDVSWQLVEDVVDPLEDFPPDANSLEAYRISVEVPYDVNARYMGTGPINVEVFDHQGLETISTVTIEAPDLFAGERSLSLSVQTGEDSWLFTGEIINETEAIQGIYPVLVRVRDTESDKNLGEMDAWQLCDARIKSGWARTWGDTRVITWQARAYDVAVDSLKNTYVTGHFYGEIDFDPGPGEDIHYADGLRAIFLSKFDEWGRFEWARTWGKRIGESLAVDGRAVAVDSSGNVYVGGVFDGTGDFNPGNGVDRRSSNGKNDCFLSRFSPDGSFDWACTWGGESRDGVADIYINTYNQVMVAGWFEGRVDFDPGDEDDYHTSNGESDAFVSVIDSDGCFVVAATWGGIDDDGCRGVTSDASGSTYVTGDFREAVDFDPSDDTDFHESNGRGDIFLSKFSLTGDFQWCRTWGGSSGDYADGIAINDSAQVYVIGHFWETADFDPGSGEMLIISNGGSDSFVSKFNEMGGFLSVMTWGGEGGDSSEDIVIDEAGDFYVTGDFRYTVDFDPGPGIEEHTADFHPKIYISKFANTDSFLWVRTWDLGAEGSGEGITAYGTDSIFAVGNVAGTVDFDPGPGEDIHDLALGLSRCPFLMKLLPDGYW